MRTIAMAVVAAAALATVAAAPGSATAAPVSEYRVCLPNTCLLPSGASAQGTVDWGLNLNSYRAVNTDYPAVTVTFAEYAGGQQTSRASLSVPRGRTVAGTITVNPATDTLGVSICPLGEVRPCPTVRVPRP
jgi:hypothetical protein